MKEPAGCKSSLPFSLNQVPWHRAITTKKKAPRRKGSTNSPSHATREGNTYMEKLFFLNYVFIAHIIFCCYHPSPSHHHLSSEHFCISLTSITTPTPAFLVSSSHSRVLLSKTTSTCFSLVPSNGFPFPLDESEHLHHGLEDTN